jgi:hypothetical protein
MNDQHKNSANITDQASKDDTDTPANQIAILTESLVLAKMQEQAGFVKHIIGSATEDAWNNTNAFEAASLEAFFEGDDGKNVDWLEIFDVNSQ